MTTRLCYTIGGETGSLWETTKRMLCRSAVTQSGARVFLRALGHHMALSDTSVPRREDKPSEVMRSGNNVEQNEE